MTPQFRPEGPVRGDLSIPDLPVQQVRELDDGWLWMTGDPELKEVPADFYLREMSPSEPMSDDDLVLFVRTWGRTADVFWRDRPATEEWDNGFGRLAQVRGSREAQTQSTARRAASQRFGIQDERDLVHLDEVRARLGTAGGWADRVRDWQRSDRPPPDDSDTIDDYMFAMTMNSALSATQVALLSGKEDYQDTVLSRPMITAYSVAAMQCFNDVMAHTPLLVCANESCEKTGRLFARQRDRAKRGQYRTSGVKYCSARCAKAQAERERRRRIRSRTNEQKTIIKEDV